MGERRVQRETGARGAQPFAAGRYDAIVVEMGGGVYECELDDGTLIEAALRGRLKQERRTGDRVVPGDRVTLAVDDAGDATIEAVAERHSELARRAPGRSVHHAKIIVANLEQLVIVFATADPEPRLRMLDRFLVIAETSGIDALIVVNKMDRADAAAAVRSLFAPYERAGYAVLYVSAETGTAIDELRTRVCGHESALAGPSGVGKSSLLNALEPGLARRVGAVSSAQRKGRHTTVSARLIRLECGGHLADTPGLRELGLWGIEPDELDHAFPEFRPFLDDCRFRGSCSHSHEPGCGVRAAVEEGAVARERYDSYLALLAEAAGDEPA